MTAQALALRLETLESRLEGLLSCFEGGPFPPDESLDAAWSRVLCAFEELRAELAGPIPAELEGNVRDCLRLYAVAAGVLARRREELTVERSACAEARARLRRHGRAAASGDSCDVRG